jgi:hypothetical protein
MNTDLALGRLLGRRDAYCLVAGRCSAADADAVRDLRNRKLYLGHAKDWGECCTKILHMSKESANRIIHYLEKFGPAYFEISQLTRISPETYRAIAPSIRDQALHHNGEVIPLIAENAPRIAAAVAEIRKGVKAIAPPASEPAEKLSAMERRCRDLVVDLRLAMDDPTGRDEVRTALTYLRGRLNDIALSMR